MFKWLSKIFSRSRKSIIKVSSSGTLYITVTDLFSQPEVQETLKLLAESSITRQILEAQEKDYV